VFLEICSLLIEMHIIGLLLSWAWVFSQENTQMFLDKVVANDEKMIAFVNEKADFYECFAENAKTGRARARTRTGATRAFNASTRHSPSTSRTQDLEALKFRSKFTTLHCLCY
jgi:hypothetical protein